MYGEQFTHNPFGTDRYELVEIPVSASAAQPFNGNTIKIPDQPMLRGMRVTRLEVYTATDMPNAPSGNPNFTSAQLGTMRMKMYIQDPAKQQQQMGVYIDGLPMLSIHRIQNAANEPFVRQLPMLNFVLTAWDKCEINVATPLGITANTSVVLGVYYTSAQPK